MFGGGGRGGGVRVAEEGAATVGMDLGLSEVVEIPEEYEDVGTSVVREGERRPVVVFDSMKAMY